MKAALSGKAAPHAFLLDPTTQARLDPDQTQALLDETLEANRATSAVLPLALGCTRDAASLRGGSIWHADPYIVGAPVRWCVPDQF